MQKVTIVIPSYNQADFLEETIQSVLTQDYAGIECIIMDGGSTDGSADIIRKYTDRLAYWVSEPDGGQSVALNRGFARATGDILTWICSDDTLLPGAVSTIVRLFEQNPGAGLIYGDAWNTDHEGRRLGVRRGVPYSIQAMVIDNLVPQPASFFSRAAWEAFGPLNESLHFAMDRELWLQMNGRTPIIYAPTMLATMRRHPEAKGERDRIRLKLAEETILDTYFATPDLPPEALSMKSAAYGRLYYYLGLYYLQAKQYDHASETLRAAIRWQPWHRRVLVVAPLLISSRLGTDALARAYPALRKNLVALRSKVAR